MIFWDKAITLKDGRQCIIRSARIDDAPDLIRYLKIISSETPYLLREPEEVTITLQQEKDFIYQNIKAEKELLLVAIVDGKHIGNCAISAMGSFKRFSHRCSIGIALYQEYCGLGIGRFMMETILEVAKDCGYEQAELQVVTTNRPAIHLYKSLGFKIYGEHPHCMKYKDGTYADEFLMIKRLQ